MSGACLGRAAAFLAEKRRAPDERSATGPRGARPTRQRRFDTARHDIKPSNGVVAFENGDWDTPQTITVIASQDGDGADDAASIRQSASVGPCGAGYPEGN